LDLKIKEVFSNLHDSIILGWRCCQGWIPAPGTVGFSVRTGTGEQSRQKTHVQKRSCIIDISPSTYFSTSYFQLSLSSPHSSWDQQLREAGGRKHILVRVHCRGCRQQGENPTVPISLSRG